MQNEFLNCVQQKNLDDCKGLRECLNRIYFVLFAAILSRLLFFALAWIFNLSFDIGRTPVNLFCSWDCSWYMSIINDGYSLTPSAHSAEGLANWAFFPLFPLISRCLKIISGLDSLLCAQIVSNLSFILFMVVLFCYLSNFFGDEIARFTVVIMAFSPYSIYFSAPYTEALYAFLMVLVLYCARAEKWLLAGACAALLSATRNLGAFIVFPLFIIGVNQYGWKRLLRLSAGTERFWLCIFLAPLGLFLYMLYLHQLMGDAMAFKNVQTAWGRIIANPFAVLTDGFLYGGVYERYCAAAACVSLATSLFLLYERMFVESLILLIGTIIPLAAGLPSLPRYIFALFPVYLALAVVSSQSQRMRLIIISCISSFNGLMIFAWISGKLWMI